MYIAPYRERKPDFDVREVKLGAISKCLPREKEAVCYCRKRVGSRLQLSHVKYNCFGLRL